MESVRKKGQSTLNNENLQVQNEDINEEVPPSRLVSLPKELWSEIYNYVPQTDKLKHRVVSKDWRKIIDEFSTVDVNFNADFPPEDQRDRVFSLRIRCSTFSSMHQKFLPNFRNPLLIKEIVFTTHVSASNVLRILSVCTKVESLRFLTTIASETNFEVNEHTTGVFNNLKSLKNLEIGILTFLDRDPNVKSRTFNAIIGNSSIVFSSLKTLNVAFLVCHMEWCQIFKFISRHSVSLKSLRAICPCGEPTTSGVDPHRSKDSLIPRDLILPQLDSVVVNGSSKCPCREDIWLLLEQQRQLTRFETYIPHSAAFMKDVITNNERTIKFLKLQEIQNMYNDELNCGLFENCDNLLELSLRFDGTYILVVCVKGGTAQQRLPVLYNLSALPRGLKKLTLCGTQIPSKELESLCTDQDRILEEVTLGRADSLKLRSTGLTINILAKLLENLKVLKKFRVFLDMICLTECSYEVNHCSELNGVWCQVLQIAREMHVVNLNEDSDESGGRCCDLYTNEACLNHRPFIDMIFKTDGIRKTFLSRIKELQQGHPAEFS